jgi:hypothetical protein
MPKITHAAGPDDRRARWTGRGGGGVIAGWYDLLNILGSVRAFADAEQSRPRIACPQCGEPLEQGPYGERHCRYDGWIGV